jgi:hypothetical protein
MILVSKRRHAMGDSEKRNAAWHEATISAGHIIRDINSRLQPGQEWRLEVTDEFANPLYIIHVHAEKSK